MTLTPKVRQIAFGVYVAIRNCGDAYNHTDISEYWTGIPRAESGQETEMVVTT